MTKANTILFNPSGRILTAQEVTFWPTRSLAMLLSGFMVLQPEITVSTAGRKTTITWGLVGIA